MKKIKILLVVLMLQLILITSNYTSVYAQNSVDRIDTKIGYTDKMDLYINRDRIYFSKNDSGHNTIDVILGMYFTDIGRKAFGDNSDPAFYNVTYAESHMKFEFGDNAVTQYSFNAYNVDGDNVYAHNDRVRFKVVPNSEYNWWGKATLDYCIFIIKNGARTDVNGWLQ